MFFRCVSISRTRPVTHSLSHSLSLSSEMEILANNSYIMLNSSQTLLNHILNIFRQSYAKLRHTLGKSLENLRKIEGIFQAYSRHFSDISHTDHRRNVRHISPICQAYLRHVSGISKSYLRKMSGISHANLRHI